MIHGGRLRPQFGVWCRGGRRLGAGKSDGVNQTPGGLAMPRSRCCCLAGM